jgi:hypothetical protein
VVGKEDELMQFPYSNKGFCFAQKAKVVESKEGKV